MWPWEELEHELFTRFYLLFVFIYFIIFIYFIYYCLSHNIKMPIAGTGGWKLIHGNGKEAPFPWLPQLGNLVDYLSWFLLDVHKPPIGKCHPLLPFLIGLLSSVFSAECFEPPIYWCFAIFCFFLSVTQYLFLLFACYILNKLIRSKHKAQLLWLVLWTRQNTPSLPAVIPLSQRG